jgi:hypothetical protein
MPWFIRLVAGATGVLITILVLDLLRRRGFPRLSLQIFRGSGIPDELSLRLAKTVSAGDFDGSKFRKGTFRNLFPTQVACPHCRGKSKGSNVWGAVKAERLLGDLGGLARQIQKRQFCRGCLGQLSGIAVEKKHLKELDKKDPRSLRRPSRRGCFLLFLGVWATPTICLLLFLILKFIFG